ncbi:MAG: sensor histidine kinase [Dermatophilaceae bacterium]
MGSRGEWVTAIALLAASSGYAAMADRTPAVLLALVLTAAQVAPLPWARHRPTLAFGLVLVAFAAHLALLPTFLPADLALLVAAFSVIAARGWWPAGVGAIVGAAAALLLALPVWAADRGLEATTWQVYLTPGVGILAAVSTTAFLAERHRARTHRLQFWQVRAISAEREREQAAVIAALAERARLARDVHDTVAHALVVIAMHGEVARRKLGAGRAEQVDQLLATLVATAREALAETRELVSILATDDVAPAVGVGSLPEMVERLRRSGCSVSLDLDQGSSFPAPVSRLVYQVAREAVTNALRHAGAGAALAISVRREELAAPAAAASTAPAATASDTAAAAASAAPEAAASTAPAAAASDTAADAVATVIVDDDGGCGPRVVPTPGAGHGIRGLRERVEAAGGRFSAGPRTPSGFRVWAEIPVRRP